SGEVDGFVGEAGAGVGRTARGQIGEFGASQFKSGHRGYRQRILLVVAQQQAAAAWIGPVADPVAREMGVAMSRQRVHNRLPGRLPPHQELGARQEALEEPDLRSYPWQSSGAWRIRFGDYEDGTASTCASARLPLGVLERADRRRVRGN